MRSSPRWLQPKRSWDERPVADPGLGLFLEELMVPYETDKVSRLIIDSHDRVAFQRISHLPDQLASRPVPPISHRRLSYANVERWDVIAYSPRAWALRLTRTSKASETCHSRDSMTGVPSRP